VASHSTRVLSLCSGIGGLDLGIRLADPRARTVCCVELETYAASVLVARMAEKALDSTPVWDSVFTFDGRPWRGKVDCVAGGFPCTPHSVAGKKRGREDDRNLWPQFARIVGEVSPSLCFFENVPNLLNTMFSDVCESLWGMGYRIEAGIFSAEEVGAPHLRKRLFIMAHSDREGWKGRGGLEEKEAERQTASVLGSDPAGCGGALDGSVHTACRSGRNWPDSVFPPRPGDKDGWSKMPDAAQPAVRGDAHGPSPSLDMHLSMMCNWEKACHLEGHPLSMDRHVCARQDRLRVLGNAVVPLVAALAWRTLSHRLGLLDLESGNA
jgi:DNA (cytosine-5)-methyltransferase 1